MRQSRISEIYREKARIRNAIARQEQLEIFLFSRYMTVIDLLGSLSLEKGFRPAYAYH